MSLYVVSQKMQCTNNTIRTNCLFVVIDVVFLTLTRIIKSVITGQALVTLEWSMPV